MSDEAVVVRIARGVDELGEFYLSYVELSIKRGTFRYDDWGWIEGMDDWKPLGALALETRKKQGKKRLATTAQRAYLRRLGFEPWRGMANREAHAILDRFHEVYRIPPGAWILEPITEAQISFLIQLGVSIEPEWNKGDACLAITQRLEDLELNRDGPER